MLNNLVISIEAVAPMFIMILTGYFARKMAFLDDTVADKLNKLIFNILFPWLIFKNLYGADIERIVDISFIIYGVSMLILDFIIAVVIAIIVTPNNKTRGAMAQAIYRSNFIVMGFPIVANIFGEEKMSITAIMIAILLPISNVLAVFVLELFQSDALDWKQVLKGIIKNPLIIGAILGMITVVFNIKLPSFIENPINSFYNAATPMALIALGASINSRNINNCKKELGICVFCRLVILPAVVLTGGMLIGFRGVEFVTLIALFAAPSPISSYTMAVQMKSDGVLAGSCVVVSSAIASFSMFCWIFLFKTLGAF